MNAIERRRSIRKYIPGREVEAPLVEKLLRAAMMAPSARNNQPWHFIVCDDRSVLDELHARHPYSGMLKTAPLCIVVLGDASLEAAPGFYMLDCAAATQNMLLMAAELGLGTCWMGVTPRQDRMEVLKDYFKLPEHISVFALVAVGWPDETIAPPERYNTDRIHTNRW